MKKKILAVVACTTFFVTGCVAHPNAEPLIAIVSPAIPLTLQEVPNPLRGQYEDLLLPLFPQVNPAQNRYPPWPGSYDASLRLSWRQLQPVDPSTLPPDTPDDHKFDFSMIDDALAKLSARHMRMTLRVTTYSSCCDTVFPNNTNIGVPDWVRPMTTSLTGPERYWWTPGVTQVVPNWNDPNYLNTFGQLLAALGRRYDGDERLSIFEFSGYGDFSENHIAYLRDTLNAPGPSPDESMAKLGYYSQFRDQSITIDSIRQLVAANVGAFPRTQLITTTLNPEIVRQMLSDETTKKTAAPVGIRSDCIGVIAPMPGWAELDGSHYLLSKDPVVGQLKDRLATAPVLTEWCMLPKGADRKAYYEKGLHDVVKYHVSMTSNCDFEDTNSPSPMDPALYQIWAQSNVAAGYRYSVEARQGSQSVKDKAATITAVWTNYGSAAATEKWVPIYKLVDFSGATVKTMPATINLKALVHNDPSSSRDQAVPVSASESVSVDMTGLAPGHYTLQAAVEWQQHKAGASHVVDYPPMHLARDGRDGSGGYPIATLDVSRDVLLSPTP
ncbi:hypothetical protein [Mycobacterium rhizamassiliense]